MASAIRWASVAVARLVLVGLAGCAALDELAVGRTDRLGGAPFYKTYVGNIALGEPAVLLPVEIDLVTREESLYAGRADALAPLIAAMNGYLRGRACCRYVDERLPSGATPYVYVGSSEGETAPAEATDQRHDYDKYPPMVIHVARGSAAWRAAFAALAAREAASRLLLVRLSFVQYPKADRGFFGKKVVLGTGYEEPIRFLSAEDKPVEVLQVTGLLLDADGRILRAGAEGILAHDTPFWLQVLEAGQDIDAPALQRLLHEERRDDLPSKPLKWQAALDSLLAQLLTAK